MKETEIDSWIEWLKQRIPELRNNKAYVSWVRQAVKGSCQSAQNEQSVNKQVLRETLLTFLSKLDQPSITRIETCDFEGLVDDYIFNQI